MLKEADEEVDLFDQRASDPGKSRSVGAELSEGIIRIMDRRFFLKMTGLAAAAGAIEVLPVAAQGRRDELVGAYGLGSEALPEAARPLPAMQAPGTYLITGRVRLQEPVVEISGVTNAQQISWSDVGRTGSPVAGFTSFEYFDKPWSMPEIRVRGGQLEELAVVPVDIG